MNSRDIEKIKILHDLKSNFKDTQKIEKELSKQFGKEKSSSEIERYFKGFQAEDIFQFVFSSFGWTYITKPHIK